VSAPGQLELALVGLTHPFRGGISHYTTLLCRALRERHAVRFYALSRQYPRLLFPGKTQIDESDRSFRIDHERAIDSIEEELQELFWPGGTQPVTQPPSISVTDAGQAEAAGSFVISLSCETEGASIGYRFLSENTTAGQPWNLYKSAFPASSGDTVEAKAVRYGWAESEVVTLELP